MMHHLSSLNESVMRIDIVAQGFGRRPSH
jgi:hypothetical protein